MSEFSKTQNNHKMLINEIHTCVEDFIAGLLYSNPSLMKIEGFNAVVRKDIEESKEYCVSLLSGGGSGHEPAHAGYIGNGMLSGAILGNIFASPSVSSILAAIRVAAGEPGVLLIVKNYTGDRLNFGMAMEKAKSEGIKCAMVVVDDDCALAENKGITGGRGIAGTIFVHKILGAAASLGLSLEQLVDVADRTINAVKTLGVALSTCTIPGTQPSARLSAPGAIEIGMGIHGEPGREQSTIPSQFAAKTIATVMVDGVLSKLWNKFGRTIKSVKNACLSVLINNLGALPVIEMGIMTKEIVEAIQAFKAEKNLSNLHLTHLYAGPYMTSLDMNGISVSVLITIDGYNMDLIKLLEMSTTAPAWVIHEENLIMLQPSDLDLSQRVIAYKAKDNSSNKVYDVSNTIYINKDIARTVISKICAKLIENEPLLTEYDQICGDGDCGLVMKKGAEQVLQGIVVDYLDNLTEEIKVNAVYLCEQVADLISQSMGGTSGVLLELFFRSMANTFIVILRGDDTKKDLTNEDWATALKTGIDAISLYGGANRGMRTMLDAFYPAYEGLATEGLQGAMNGAKSGVEATKTMEGLAGRSNYIDSKLMTSVPDPGAYAVYLAFQAIQESF